MEHPTDKDLFRLFTSKSLAAMKAHDDEVEAARKMREAAATAAQAEGGGGTGGGSSGAKRRKKGSSVGTGGAASCSGNSSKEDGEDTGPREPDPKLEVGKKLPPYLGDYFPVKTLAGKPIEEVDKFFEHEKTFVVIASDKTIFRFSATKALFLIDPLNPIRRAAISILVHPQLCCSPFDSSTLFTLLVLLAIITNCVFMALNNSSPPVEYTFTAFYTFEACIKAIARGIILTKFTYLRDAWNWLDFIVIGLAYLMFVVPSLGNLSALRSLRVLRALKTVTTVPGLKTIVGALMEGVKHLRDVAVLTVFVLSIFALIGLQIYRGTLLNKCITEFNATTLEYDFTNYTEEEIWSIKFEFYNNETNWVYPQMLCRNITSNGLEHSCDEGFVCIQTMTGNPNFGYTNFDNFGWSFLCAFRLMTQDYWENLYQLVIRSNGKMHISYFMMVIFLGSYYLINVILAIVAMSYDEVRRQDIEDAEEEEAARKEEEERREQIVEGIVKKSPSEMSNLSAMDVICLSEANRKGDDRVDKWSIRSDGWDGKRVTHVFSIRRRQPKSASLPASPYAPIKGIKQQNNCDQTDQPLIKANGGYKTSLRHSTGTADQDLLELVNLPYADESADHTPMTEEDALRISPARRSSKLGGLYSRHNSLKGHPATKALVLDKISHSSSPHEARKYRDFLIQHRVPDVVINHSLSPDPLKEDENENSPHHLHQKNINGGVAGALDHSRDSTTTFAVEMHELDRLNTLIDDVTKCGRRSLLSALRDENTNSKEVLLEWFLETFCSWTPPPIYIKFQGVVSYLILDAFTEMFITLCIVGNTIFMAIDSPHKSPEMDVFLKNANYFFTTTFTLECGMKLIALSPKIYFKDGWNIFDFLIVTVSLVELVLAGKGLSILRTFRLLRVFKLAKSWKTMNLLFAIIGRTVGALGNLTFVLGIIIFIFAVVGMQLFGENYTGFENVTRFPRREGKKPRWNFCDFTHSFMIVFRVLCGEWIESMWECMLVNGPICIPFFLLTMILGNLVLLNLFLALLLSSFSSESLQRREEEEEANKLQEAIDRIYRAGVWLRIHVLFVTRRISRWFRKSPFCCCHKPPSPRSGPALDFYDDNDVDYPGTACAERSEVDLTVTLPLTGLPSETNQGKRDSHDAESGMGVKDTAIEIGGCVDPYCTQDDSICLSTNGQSQSGSLRSPSPNGFKGTSPSDSHKVHPTSPPTVACLEDRSPKYDDEPEINDVQVHYWNDPESCFPKFMEKCLAPCINRIEETSIGKLWWAFRCHSYHIVEHRYFEGFILVMIVLSSVTLTLEDRYLAEKPILPVVLEYMDKAFTIIFTIEMLIKWVAFGWNRYFRDAWCWLDFVIVTIALLSAAITLYDPHMSANMSAFKAMRTLRALRPLRAVSRWEGMKVVVNALIQAIPSIFNVLLVCLVFWLIFSIMGMQLFGGKFAKCMDKDKKYLLPASIYPNKTVCLLYAEEFGNVTWHNSRINFDNFLNGYLALFQVATFKGWIEIMADAVDSTEIDVQHVYNNSTVYYLYFVLFIIAGAFFTLNLFIGVIIDNFNVQKKKVGGSIEMFMTEDQKKYYNAMKKMSNTAPQKPIPKPKFKVARVFFAITSNQKFDIIIMVFICLNTFTMCIEHHNQSLDFKKTLEEINKVFIVIFTAECVSKLIAQRWHYFKLPWNMFDFVIVVFSILCWAVERVMEYIPIPPTLIRVVRVFRIGRVLRLVKSARGIRTLLFSLIVSLPALFNIAILLMMVMFIYSIVGMAFFSKVSYYAGIDPLFNFETFGQSMIVLFQISTSAGWNSVLDGLMNEGPPQCSKELKNCGSFLLAVAYLISYLVISFLVIVNMYIAVILENFSQATEDVQHGLTQDDYDLFYEMWEEYDPLAKGFMPLENLSQFVERIGKPLGMDRPNTIRLATLAIPICQNDTIYCVDLLDALTRNFLGQPTEEEGEMAEVKPKCKVPTEEKIIISNTYQRRKEQWAALVVTYYVKRILHRLRQRKANGEIVPSVTVDAAEPNDTASINPTDEEPSATDRQDNKYSELSVPDDETEANNSSSPTICLHADSDVVV